MKSPSVELIYFTGCPNADAARSSIAGAFREIGADPQWTEWDVLSDETPTEYHSYPSPTVLVGGHDVIEAGARVEVSDETGISCRAEGAPNMAQVLAALEKAE